MSALTPLAKQHDAVFSLLNDDGTQEPIRPPKSTGQKHADRVLGVKGISGSGR
jgi:hypothetical protein